MSYTNKLCMNNIENVILQTIVIIPFFILNNFSGIIIANNTHNIHFNDFLFFN